MVKKLLCANEADVRQICADNLSRKIMTAILVREMRSLWLVEINLQILAVLESGRDWYQENGNPPPPDGMLSTVTRPAADCDKLMAHRLLALSRAAKKDDLQDTLYFQFYKVSTFIVFEELRKILDLSAINEACLQFKELVAFLAAGTRCSLSEEDFTRQLTSKINRYIDVWREISEAFAKFERELLGQGADDPVLRRLEGGLEELSDGVARLLKRKRSAPASSRTQKWVWDQYGYYTDHPEACVTDVTRRRVYLRDVWAAVKAKAESDHGIKTFEDFKIVYRTSARAHQRQKKGIQP